MRMLALFSISALGGSLALNAATTSAADDTQSSETPANIIAAQIRKQGYPCDHAQRAVKDAKLDKPDLPVWILTCDNATYRVRLVGDMTDRVEKLADGKSDH